MKKHLHQIRRQHGLSLVELMVSITIGLILILGMSSLLLQNKQTYYVNSSTQQVQQNSRFVLHTLKSAIRHAGYSSYYADLSEASIDNILSDKNNFLWDIKDPIIGFNDITAGQTIGGVDWNIKPETDVLMLRSIINVVPLGKETGGNELAIPTTTELKDGMIMLVADANHASLFQATTVGPSSNNSAPVNEKMVIKIDSSSMTPGNSLSSINNHFSATTESVIGQLDSTMFYISTGENGRPALFQASLIIDNGTKAELIPVEIAPNVDNMQLIYGIDTNGDREVDAYQDASAVANWNNVLSIQIALLLMTEGDGTATKTTAHTFDSSDFSYKPDTSGSSTGDRYLRRAFYGYSTLRNRVL